MEFLAETTRQPRYSQLAVTPDIILYFDMDDTWISIRDNENWDCSCIVLGRDEVDILIDKLKEAKELIKNGV